MLPVLENVTGETCKITFQKGKSPRERAKPFPIKPIKGFIESNTNSKCRCVIMETRERTKAKWQKSKNK